MNKKVECACCGCSNCEGYGELKTMEDRYRICGECNGTGHKKPECNCKKQYPLYPYINYPPLPLTPIRYDPKFFTTNSMEIRF